MGSQRVTNKYTDTIMKLHDEGLNPATIARRVPYTARTVARVIKREQERLSKLVECEQATST